MKTNTTKEILTIILKNHLKMERQQLREDDTTNIIRITNEIFLLDEDDEVLLQYIKTLRDMCDDVIKEIENDK